MLDNRSDYYNRYRNKSQGGFRWRLPSSHPDGSERLKDFPQQYEFAFTTTFNAQQVRHRGGAIFLHVNGSGATAGCVSRAADVHAQADVPAPPGPGAGHRDRPVARR